MIAQRMHLELEKYALTRENHALPRLYSEISRWCFHVPKIICLKDAFFLHYQCWFFRTTLWGLFVHQSLRNQTLLIFISQPTCFLFFQRLNVITQNCLKLRFYSNAQRRFVFGHTCVVSYWYNGDCKVFNWEIHNNICNFRVLRPGPVFCLLLRVTSGCAQSITEQVTQIIVNTVTP